MSFERVFLLLNMNLRFDNIHLTIDSDVEKIDETIRENTEVLKYNKTHP